MKPQLPIYLDYHATTPVDPKVLEAMLPYFTSKFGNASSKNHSFGLNAEQGVELARKQVASLIGAEADEIVFTSGGTEADNLAISGVAHAYREKGNHLITAKTEHKAVLDSCKALEKEGFEITYLNVDRLGTVPVESVRKAITEKTILFSVMAANNEVGTIQELEALGKLAKEKEVLFHCDAVQGVGKIPIDVQKMGIDLLSISAHKIYGPKGVGALYVRKKNPRVRLAALFHGGGQEKNLRSGTLNVPGIVGLGKACELAEKSLSTESKRLQQLRKKLDDTLRSKLDRVFLNGHPEKRLPGNLSLVFEGVDGEVLMKALPEIALSSGSACNSANREASYVLKAMQLNDELAHSTLRFGIGRFTTEEEIEFTSRRVIEEVQRLRELSPLHHGKSRN